jgi:micrococcal nuclease
VEVATVTAVVDGDTIDVMIDGRGPDTVRLIGINAPEDGECLARESGTALAELLAGEEGTKGPFTMTGDVSNRDQYGRLLRYLWLEDGTFVNEFMVRWGGAIARDYPPDSSHAARLAAAQALAEADLAGLWVPDACGTATKAEIAISGMHPDAAGNDHENRNDEWVDLTNTGTTTVDMTGWVLKDESSTHRFHFPPTFALAAGAEVRIYTGCGTQIETELHWCNGSAVWNNDGDTAFLLDNAGNIVDSRSY